MQPVYLEKKGNTKIVSHRGLSGVELENTLAAFVAAGNRCCFGIETDVHVTADGKYVILHDDRTGRVGERDLPAENSTFAQLREVRLHEQDTDGYSDIQRLLSLQEYLRVVRRYEKTAVIELKNPMAEKYIAEIVQICKTEYDLEKIIFISFCFENLVQVRKMLPQQKIQFLTGKYTPGLISRLTEYGMGLDIWYGALTQEHVNDLHAAGIVINCFTCDDPADAQKLISWGVDMITSNILL